MATTKHPRVSIVIPCYNAAAFVGATIRSVLAQTCDDWELLAVDDGSTDATAEIIRSFGDERIRYVYQANRGPGSARNLGVLLARAPYIAFLDADDLALPHRLATQSHMLDDCPDVDVIGSGYVWVDGTGTELPWHHQWMDWPSLEGLCPWLYGCPLVPSATILRRSAYLAVAGMEEDLLGGEDWNLWMKLALAGSTMIWQREVVCHYRIRRDSLSNRALSMSRDCPLALQRILDDPRFPPSLRADGRLGLALRYLDSMKRLYLARQWETGSAALQKALHLDPTLAEGRPSRLEDELIVATLSPLVADPSETLGDMLAHLPTDIRETLGIEHLRWRLAFETLSARGKSDRRSQMAGALPLLAALPLRLLDGHTRGYLRRALANRLARLLAVFGRGR